MNYKLLNRIFAAVVFLISFIVLFATVQPSVSFWDCGEFLAASFYLQVPHPPGTPFFLLLGKIFSMLPFFDNVGLRINIISVLSSGLSVMFLYLIAVKLIENYKGKKPQNLLDAIGTYTAAAIGALSFSFSDTFWFNGVEAEVYAFSTFLVAFITWLMLRWHERADGRDNEKYILMIAYLVGLSTGVHLMSVLTIVPVVMIILFRKYVDNPEETKKSGYLFMIHAGIILIIALAMWASQKSSTPPSPEQYQEYDSKFKMIITGISIVYMGIFWRKIFNRNSFYLPLIIGGVALFAVYPGVVKVLPGLMSSIAAGDTLIGVILLLVIFAALAYGVRYSIKEKKPTYHLVFMSLIFVLIGFTTFSMVIIRANDDPPMNENKPDDFSELVSYLNREQYGDFPTFKRRFSSDDMHRVTYANYTSDLDFFWTYQMNHMMTRYWLWNYAGRTSWEQDDGVDVAPFNQIGNFFGKALGINFSGSVKDSLFGIPFLLGLLGIYFHFRKDWKMASVFMIMFILLGYLTAFYQNQQQPQPRERDYFYVGAFFVFSIWIAIAIRGLIDLIGEKAKSISIKNVSVFAVLILGIILVPANMLRANYFTHDRSGNWLPWDYSYNILQSCAPNAILFTNGDNDTFPLWYLQDVEGVRRDVKVVNLSLLNTSWYILQMKNNDPYNVGTININLSDEQIEQVRPVQWEAQQVTIPLPDPEKNKTDLYEKYNVNDSSVIKAGKITFTMNPTLNFGNIKAVRVQDLMVRQIVLDNAWKRPIYFAVTCSNDSKIGLGSYLKMEGMASRLVPEKGIATNGPFDLVNDEIIEMQITENYGYSKDYKPGFKFRGLNDPDIFFDDNQTRMVQNYRNAFLALSLDYLKQNKNDLAELTLDKMEEKIPRNLIGFDRPEFLAYVGDIYLNAGAEDKAIKIYNEFEQSALANLEKNPTDINSIQNLVQIYERTKQYGKAASFLERLSSYYPNDPNIKAGIQRFKTLDKLNNEKNAPGDTASKK